MLVSTQALVFTSVKYAEADLIVSCFTKDYGLKSYMLRGILKSKKGKLRTSFFLPLTQLSLDAFHKDKGTLERIQEAKVLLPYKTLHTNVVKSGMVMFLAEMLKNSIQEEEANALMYEYISDSLQWLDNHDDIANFHILFLLNLTQFLGFYPDTSKSSLPAFNLMDGVFENEAFGGYSHEGTGVETLKLFFGINFDALQTINATKTERLEALNLLLIYYQLHLHGFKKPKSLLVLNQLFN